MVLLITKIQFVIMFGHKSFTNNCLYTILVFGLSASSGIVIFLTIFIFVFMLIPNYCATIAMLRSDNRLFPNPCIVCHVKLCPVNCRGGMYSY